MRKTIQKDSEITSSGTPRGENNNSPPPKWGEGEREIWEAIEEVLVEDIMEVLYNLADEPGLGRLRTFNHDQIREIAEAIVGEVALVPGTG